MSPCTCWFVQKICVAIMFSWPYLLGELSVFPLSLGDVFVPSLISKCFGITWYWDVFAWMFCDKHILVKILWTTSASYQADTDAISNIPLKLSPHVLKLPLKPLTLFYWARNSGLFQVWHWLGVYNWLHRLSPITQVLIQGLMSQALFFLHMCLSKIFLVDMSRAQQLV